MPDQELERFKTAIDLRVFAASYGYSRDESESSSLYEVMRNSNDDKIIIHKKGSHWVYCCARNSEDHGSIIDFCYWRVTGQGKLGQVRKLLREWTGGNVEVAAFYKTRQVRPITNDRQAIILAWEQARPVSSLAYLIGRGIDRDILELSAFAGIVRVDERGNVLFPHYDLEGLCGFEIKNAGFTGFASGGKKGLWYSKPDPNARTIVFCESAIDAISYYALNRGEPLRVFSTGGSLSQEQLRLVRRTMEKLPPGSRVVLAFDADEAGDQLAAEVLAVAPGSVSVHRELPPVGTGKDWNDVLKYQKGIIDNPTLGVGPEHGKTPPPLDLSRAQKPSSSHSKSHRR